MPIDRLGALLQRFSVSARMFHSGPLCGINDIPTSPDIGQLHLIRRGPVEVHHGSRRTRRVVAPSLLFYPRVLPHRFVTDAEVGADMACANVAFVSGASSPLVQALPAFTVLPLEELDGARGVLELLFEEAFAQRCGRQHVVDRLFEVVLIHVLRVLMDSGRVDRGALAGMADPKLARALVAMHEKPAANWTLDTLAQRAGMSRSHFAARFHQCVGATPGDYLSRFRISVAQDLLRRGQPLKAIAGEAGYGSSAALSRAFRAICGVSPRAWRAGSPDGAG